MVQNDALRHFWWRAEYPEAIFAADEVRFWPAGQIERLRRLGLLREGDLSSSVICFNCGHPHSAVVFYPSQDLFGRTRPHIICPDEGLIEVDFDDMRQWLVDRPALARVLVRALEAAGYVQEIVPNRVWALGRRHLAGRFREFFLAVGMFRPDGPAMIEHAGRIGSASSPVILVPSKLPRGELWRDSALPLFCLSEIAILQEDRLTLDVAYIEGALYEKRTGPLKTTGSFAVPDGAAWENLTIAVDETALRAVIGGARKMRSLEDCGFTRGHGEGDMALQTLRLFAYHHGSFSTRDAPVANSEKTPFKKQVSVLRRQLRTLFPIEGEPIVHHKVSGRYQCTFRISLEGDPCFPTGESWLDYRFEELDAGRIRVSVKSTEILPAVSRSRDAGATRDVAVGEARRSAEYSLDRLGLADSGGVPTAEGQVLLAFLRGEGRLRRKPDDLALLRLSQYLRNLSGVANDPFQYSDRKGVWVTLFECGTARQQ
jgi:hypothetical protein